ncbi:MAG: DNA-directed RNA polymerase subunit beta [Clostridia bacterium]|nr:DNA-directed RNA polymerase subunit beta [Clostridia bacterium]
MVKPQMLGTTQRMSFSKIDEVLEMPNLLEVQKKSYQWFLDEGLQEVLRDVSPIVDYSGNIYIEFIDYTLDDTPKYPEEECKDRDVNFAAPLRVKVRLYNKNTEEVIDRVIYVGDFPLMTDNGTFIINGAERVIVSQIVRSPGMYYDSQIDKSGKKVYTAQIIPYRGAWLEYETDANDVFSVRIDKNRKIPVTVLLRALGLGNDSDLISVFGEDPKIMATIEKDGMNAEAVKNGSTAEEEALKEIYRKLRPGEPPLVDSAQVLINNMFFDPKRYDLAPVGRYKYNKKVAIGKRVEGRILTRPAISPVTGEFLYDEGTYLTAEIANALEFAGVNELYVRHPDDESATEVKVISNGTVYPEAVLGFNLREVGIKEKVDFKALSDLIEEVGTEDRAAFIKACRERSALLSPKHITKADIFASVNYLVCLSHDCGTVDDIDHLGNRRLRSVGELLQNQFRIGFSRMDKIVKERMTVQDSESLTPETLINIRPIVTAIRDFFGSSPLSQFMDQNNPLAEVTHKRRLSALGPGGLSRDRASFDVRDVHYTHYGRMCPIETPEGPNIGLISYLSTYAKVNEYGFIEAPYRKIKKIYDENGKYVESIVTNEVDYMTADVEDNYTVAQANEPLDENFHFINPKVSVRRRSEILEVNASEADYMDVSPKMVVSVATSFIPFLENDDNSRALMGSNMQKQAVPLMVSQAPIVGTGMEYKAAIDSGVVICAKNSGVAERVTADEIVIRTDAGTKDTYHLLKFKRSNQGTCVNQRPIINEGDYIDAGRVIADGPATDHGEISLGKNPLIGFMTWEGYNYEDAVLLNERLVRDDVYTSIHIEEYTHEARDTKLGPEEITREIPNVGDDALKDLNAEGIVRKGTEVRSGDILVGKVTPKGETELTAEERLLRAIFGEKAREVRDTSMRLPHGESGIVVDVKVFSRENSDELGPGVNKVVRVYVAQKRKISVGDKMAGRHGNKGVVSRILPPEDMPFLADGTPLDIVLNPLGVPSRMNIGQVLEVHLGIAARKLGWKVMTPVFDGANEKDIAECMKLAGMYRDVLPSDKLEGKTIYLEEVNEETGEKSYPEIDVAAYSREELLAMMEEHKLKIVDGKSILYDGRTGRRFDNPVTVGIMYYLKLHHLVDDKIHARSTGPYSLVTQQPLGGKAQFGGQRFGEMEVWALEAYGAAYTLQEILTIKSDDVTGRVKCYEAIVKGENIPTPGVPAAFKVLVKELQSLALNVKVLNKDGDEIDLSTLDDEDELMAPTFTEEEIGSNVVTKEMGEGYFEETFTGRSDNGDGVDEYGEDELFTEMMEDVDDVDSDDEF